MRQRHQAFDWTATPIGPMASWPRALQTALSIALGSRQPMFIAWGPELTFLYNDAYAEILGDKHPGALGRPFQQVWWDIWDDIKPLVDRALADEATWSENLPLTMNRRGFLEETWWTFSYSPVRDDDGRIGGMFCSCLETTIQVLAERQNTEQRQRLFELSRDLFGVATTDGYLKSVNPAWSHVLGRTEEELLTRPFSEIIHPDDLGTTAEVVAALARGEAAHQFHVRLLKADGEAIAFAWSAVPDAASASGIFYTVGRDITEELRRDEMLRHSQKMDAMGQLTGGVAHDFNNLLMPIIGSLDMLQRKGVGDQRSRRMIDGALQSAERAKTLVQRLLGFARRQPLQPQPIDLAALVLGMESLLASTVGPRVRISYDLESDLPSAVADANQLEMALLNLAVNGRDAMPEGGVLTIHVGLETFHHQHGSELRPGRYLQLCVHDTGVGMDEATRVKATEPFFSTKGIGRGTGLGLSMVHGLAAQLGGALSLESAPGEGTTVKIWLPLSGADPTALASAAESAPGPHSGTVLLVDDETLVRSSTADMLADLGYRVVEAESAAQALRKLDEEIEIQILVTDHLMPEMTGAELVVAARRRHPGLHCLIVSGYAEESGISADFVRLTKPFRQAELAEKLAGLAAGLEN
ncbi:hybrid sensor histidine kinase/response regulator [Caulobacter sp. FWC2]|nr:hybrid sensor histidine kinase/response regulator [Caulobacter sp. FWC2]